MTEKRTKKQELKTQQLSTAEDRHRVIFENIPGLVWLKDFDGRFIEVNSAFARSCGRPPAEIIGKTDYDIRPRDLADKYCADDQAVIKSGKPLVVEELIEAGSGTQWFETMKAPVFDEHGRVIGTTGLARSIAARKKLEEAVRESEALVQQLNERFTLAVDAAGVGVWDQDLNSRTLIWDERMYRLYQMDPERFNGRYEDWQNCIHPEDRLRVHEEVQQAIRGIQELNCEFRILLPSGAIRHIRAIARVMPGVDGTPARLTGVNYDITEQRRIEETLTSHAKDMIRINDDLYREKKQTELILHDIGDGVAVVDLSGSIVMLNAIAKDLLGVAATINGASMTEELFMNCALSERQQQIIRGELPPETFSVTVDLETPLFLDVNCTTLHDEKKQAAGQVFVFHDITRKQEIDRMKSNFISSVSHELRTPLTSIKGFVKTILNDPLMPEDTRRDFLTIIDKEAERLTGLIEDILEISRIEAGKTAVVREPYSIEAVLERIAPSMQRMAAEKGLQLQCSIAEGLPALIGDSGKIQSVFTNLLVNAIKFTPAGGSIVFSAFQEGPAIIVQVKDTGLGIPAKDLPRIFERFYRVQRPGTEIPGTGLGLSICQDLVKLHGGRISVESILNKGTLFSIDLPLDYLPADSQE